MFALLVRENHWSENFLVFCSCDVRAAAVFARLLQDEREQKTDLGLQPQVLILFSYHSVPGSLEFVLH